MWVLSNNYFRLYKIQSLTHVPWNLKMTYKWQTLLEQPLGFGFQLTWSFTVHGKHLLLCLMIEFKYSYIQHQDGDIRLCGTHIFIKILFQKPLENKGSSIYSSCMCLMFFTLLLWCCFWKSLPDLLDWSMINLVVLLIYLQ